MFEVPIRFRFFDKLKLYNDFITKKSIYQNKLWDECQSILAWSSSANHKHIGVFLDTNIICGIFGIDKSLFKSINNNANKTKSDILSRLSNRNDNEKKDYIKIINSMPDGDINRQELKDKLIKFALQKSQIKNYFNDKFVENVTTKIINDNLGNIEPAIKNLHVMGFGDLDSEGKKIRINQKGFLMGELIQEINGNKWKSECVKAKYIFVIWSMRFFIFLLVLYSLVFMINYLVDFFIN